MDYNHIAQFLDRFKILLSRGEGSLSAIKDAINEHIPVVIDENLIRIKGAVIYIHASPLVHNEILIKKALILKKIKEKIPDSRFLDIR
ncbi:MAG: hypothetical protein V4665_01390 [Patescibacteria group bacterium]